MIGRKTKGITRLKKLSAYQVLEILFPVAFHYGMMLLAAMLTGNFLDAASQTTLAALLALPFLWMLYKKEPKPEKKYSRRSLWLLPFVGMAREHPVFFDSECGSPDGAFFQCLPGSALSE